MSRASVERRVQVGFFVVLLAVFAYLAWLIVRPFATYLLAAVLLAFLLRPAQRRLASRVGPRVSALALVAVAVAATGATMATVVLLVPTTVSEVAEAVRTMPGAAEIERRVEAFIGTEVPIEPVLADLPRRLAELLVGDVTGLLETTTDFFLGLVLLVFVLYHLLQEGDALVDWIRARMPLDEDTTAALVSDAHDTTWAVLKGHVFIAVAQGLIAGAGLFVVGIPYVPFWTLAMMLLSLLPVIGVTAVLVPAAVYLVTADRILAALFLFGYSMTVVALVDDYLRAYVVDRESSLHSATILVGVLGGVYAFGFMGLFFGPVVVGLFRTLVRLFDENVVHGDGDGDGAEAEREAPRNGDGEPGGEPSRQG
ncbi:AI-2E family transporter [Halobacteriales archaeon QH_1_68_42]|nr:MAG: AI-2E family transporter [Halobacteriales archaeon QH_1_68_42]